ncbi:hypothetical protein AWW70_19120 [Bacillus mycoides]|uniref:Probable transposase IS891/IS1136/IS1341 domain-containing protein n=1 Tax=Bacillus mycoides TaxID=1405 RepID=A0A120EED8_BACMY|nr:hypothetical protein AWW70_19120 [Bacillus mycoides]
MDDIYGMHPLYLTHYPKVVSFLKLVKDSVRWNKQRICVAKLHEKVANQRKNSLHHKSKELAANFDVVTIEDLHMKGMSLSELTYECSCGLTMSRDYNAAINIKKEAIHLLALA